MNCWNEGIAVVLLIGAKNTIIINENYTRMLMKRCEFAEAIFAMWLQGSTAKKVDNCCRSDESLVTMRLLFKAHGVT